ncbi:MAG: hypothetical protein OEM46_03885 [Ignavibacteria bacterium]|nr:hypothetical protein [Ignavibacteria bacterium]
MNVNKIEQLDVKRFKYQQSLALAGSLFVIVWFLRFFALIYFSYDEILYSILITLILLIIIQLYSAFHLIKISNELRTDNDLKDALNNELVMLYQLKSWRHSFFSLILFSILLGIISSIVPVDDLVFVLVSYPLVGFTVYNMSYYLYLKKY